MLMDKIDILFKCIILLYREQELGDVTSSNSKDLVKTIVTQMKKEKKEILGGEIDIKDDLLSIIVDMINNTEAYEKNNLLQSLQVFLKDQPNLFSTIEKALTMDISPPGLKRSILSLRLHLNNYYKKVEITNIINKASYQLKLGNVDEGINEFTSKLIVNLEALNNTTSKTKDVGIVDEIDIDEDDDLEKSLSKVKKNTNGDGRLKTGWKELNEMLNGGFRKGETVLISALQHNFKSGMLRSLFAQLCMYNKPVMKQKDKKPLNLFISFEDDADVAVEFFYKYLYYAEHGKEPEIDSVSIKEIGDYLRKWLSITGYRVKILRVNPSEWTYKSIFNKILEYEASGYEIHVLATDYLSKLPTTYCDNTGPMGTAFRTMLTNMRDYTSSKEILYLNAHQLSTEAKQLLRNGISSKDLVKEIANKGYYEGSRQLDQVVDLELHQHICKLGKQKYYLTIQRGKRRYPEIVDDDKKYFMLPFPPKVPCIPPNINLEGKYIGFSYSQDDSIPFDNDDDLNF